MTPTTSTVTVPVMLRLAIVTILTTCVGWGASTAHAAPAAAPYAGMFKVSATWTYDVTSERTFGVEAKPAPDVQEHGTAICRVEQVRRLGNATVATVSCEPAPGTAGRLGDLDDLRGDWVATSRGLWRAWEPISSAAAVRKLTRGTMVMPAKPRIGHAPPLKSAPAAYAYQTRQGERWCTIAVNEEASFAGESTTCFEDGAIASITSSGESYGEGGARIKGTVTRLR